MTDAALRVLLVDDHPVYGDGREAIELSRALLPKVIV